MANYDNMNFNQAFKAARQGGIRTFTWKGKNYGTRVAGESDFDYEHGLINRIGNQSRPTNVDVLFGQNTPTQQAQRTQQVETPNMDSMSFSQAFRQARNNGMSTFTWKGKDYGTKLKSEVQTPTNDADKPLNNENNDLNPVEQDTDITVNPTSETPIEVKATKLPSYLTREGQQQIIRPYNGPYILYKHTKEPNFFAKTTFPEDKTTFHQTKTTFHFPWTQPIKFDRNNTEGYRRTW